MADIRAEGRKSAYDYAFVALVSIALLAYEVARAGRVALTFDEAATYLNYVSRDILGIFDFSVANNHFLNTVLAKLSALAFGSSELALRLPSLVAFALFLVFSFRLLDRFTRRAVALPGFLLLSFNPYVLDFFSLCRGYGLSLALLVAALYFLLSFFDREIRTGAGDRRDLAKATGAAALAVMANFTLILAFISLVLVAGGVLVVRNAAGPGRTSFPEPAGGRAGFPARWVPIVLAALVFNLFVALHDFGLTGRFFSPVQVRIQGLADEEARSVRVRGLASRNRKIDLAYEKGAWVFPGRTECLGLELRIPSGFRSGIRRIDVQTGPRAVVLAGPEMERREIVSPGPDRIFFLGADVAPGRSILPPLRSAINWRGDGPFLLLVAKRGAVLAGPVALLILAVVALGRLLARTKLLPPLQFRALAAATLALGAFAAYPLAILKTSGELYWGGGGGFLHDTVGSLIQASAYGRLYFKGQTLAVGLSIAGLALAFLIRLASRRGGDAAEALPGVLVLSILVLAAGGSILLKVLLENPSLMGRTALFFIPLTAVFCVLAGQSLSLAGKAARLLVPAFLALAALGAAAHLARTANTVMTVDWRSDADIKAVLADLDILKDGELADKPKLLLGVDWNFLPSLAYYVERRGLTWLDVAPYIDRSENDFYYLREAFDPARMALVKSYPASGTILVRAKGDAADRDPRP